MPNKGTQTRIFKKVLYPRERMYSKYIFKPNFFLSYIVSVE